MLGTSLALVRLTLHLVHFAPCFADSLVAVLHAGKPKHALDVNSNGSLIIEGSEGVTIQLVQSQWRSWNDCTIGFRKLMGKRIKIPSKVLALLLWTIAFIVR